MDAFVDHISIINFFKATAKSVNDCFLYQLNHQNNVDENVAYLLNNITISNSLDTWLHIKKYFLNLKIPKNLNELYINDSRWIGFEKLLEIDCKSVIMKNDRIWEEEWNLFIKKWIAMETNQNLEYMELDNRNLDIFRIHVLHDIPHEVVDGGVERTLKT